MKILILLYSVFVLHSCSSQDEKSEYDSKFKTLWKEPANSPPPDALLPERLGIEKNEEKRKKK